MNKLVTRILCRLIVYFRPTHDRKYSWHFVECLQCNWYGPERRARHGYRAVVTNRSKYIEDDIEQADYCPQCDSDLE